MLDTPTIDLIDKIVRMVGVPAIAGAIIWAVKVFDKGSNTLKQITTDTAETKRMSMEALGGISTIQTNHLVHLAEDMKAQKEKQETTVLILGNIDKNIEILVDRTPRA